MIVYRITDLPPAKPQAGVVIVDAATRPGAPYPFRTGPAEDRPSWEHGGHE